MSRAVKFSRYGGPEVLEVVDVPMPVPGEGEVLIEVVAAGLNPADSRLREGRLAGRIPAHFPQGQGSDFAGYVMGTGPGVTQCEVNDAVIGHAARASHATHVVVSAMNVTPKPPHLRWEVAGGLYVTGTTAWAAVNALGIGQGDTVVVSAAAGGVGCIASQLARQRGATVIGTAGAQNADFLRQINIIPVDHDGAVVEGIRALAPDGVDAYLDAYGGANPDIARQLGVPAPRIRSIIDWEGVHDYGVDEYGVDEYGEGGHGPVEHGPLEHRAADGGAGTPDTGNAPVDADELVANARGARVVERLAQLAELHQLLLPVSDIFSLEQAREAFEALDRGHTRGKIVFGMHQVEYPRQRVRGARVGGEPLKESKSTVDVPTEHSPTVVRENLPPVIGHLPGQRHPHPSDEDTAGG